MFTEKPNPNTGQSVYYNGKFVGLYSSGTITQFSGIDNQIFCKELMVQFLREKYPNKVILAHYSRAGDNQGYYKVSINRIICESGGIDRFEPQG